MAKHGKSFYLELSREIFKDEYKGLSTNAKWLYTVLTELEHRLTGKGENSSFYQSDSDLSELSGIKRTALKEAKKELADSGLIEVWQAPLGTDGKRTRKHITHYRLPQQNKRQNEISEDFRK